MSDTAEPAATPVTERRGSALVIRTPAKMLDSQDCDAIAALVDAAPVDVSDVVVDLSTVRIIPSLSLGALVRLGTACRGKGKSLTLAAVNPQVRKVFTITRLDQVFTFADSVDDAAGR